MQTAETTGEKEADVEGEGEILSQRNFAHTPFEASAWEFVGERLASRDFASMEIEIIASEMTQPDPMFRDFGNNVRNDTGSYAHAGAAAVETEPVIDEAVLEAARAEAYEQGLAAGREEGKGEAVAEATALHEELAKRQHDFHVQVVRELQSLAARTEKNAFELALSVSRKILSTTAEIRPEYILDVIREALQTNGAGKPLRVRVSPQDFEFLEVVGVPPDLSAQETGVTYVPDDGIASGCVVETDFGEIDLRLEHMWQQVKENLYDVVK